MCNLKPNMHSLFLENPTCVCIYSKPWYRIDLISNLCQTFLPSCSNHWAVSWYRDTIYNLFCDRFPSHVSMIEPTKSTLNIMVKCFSAKKGYVDCTFIIFLLYSMLIEKVIKTIVAWYSHPYPYNSTASSSTPPTVMVYLFLSLSP